jgi:magnesium chelatase family protein
MGSKLVQKHCRIPPDSEKLLMTAIDKLNLSARANYRILKIARTIADLYDQTEIQTSHIAEAIQYRSLDRGNCYL